MNQVQLLGTMTRDVEIRYSQSGAAIGNFSVAYNEKWTDSSGQKQEKAHFVDCTAFGKTAENIQKYFNKGSRILIRGSLDYQSWEKEGKKRSKLGVKVIGFDFIDRKGDGNQQAPAENRSESPNSSNQQGTFPVVIEGEDEIPFAPIGGMLCV